MRLDMNSNLKIAVAALGLATLVASPVLAKPVHHQVAQAGVSDVVVAPNGKVLGADPDPAVRLQLQRDWAAGSGD
jgi:hypothetical protein